MTAKLCIHPRQVAAVHAAMTPSADLVEWAQKVMAVAESDGSAIAVDGQMIDKPVVDRARAILAEAQCTASSRHASRNTPHLCARLSLWAQRASTDVVAVDCGDLASGDDIDAVRP